MLKKSWLHVKRQWFPYFFAYGAKFAIRLLLKTCRLNIHGLDLFVKTAVKSPSMLMLWHSRLILVSEILNFYAPQFIYTAFISKSRDGNPLARLAESYPNGRALRVPHNARHIALNQLIESLKVRREIGIITPDGPRGPKQVVKPGVVLAARETKATIFPFSWKAEKFWQLKTWDQMKIPKPFTRIDVFFGSPIYIGDEKSTDLQKVVSSLKTTLDLFEDGFETEKEK